jgi:hypothetical protein
MRLMSQMVRMRGVEVIEPFRARLQFTDGSQREVDPDVLHRGLKPAWMEKETAKHD